MALGLFKRGNGKPREEGARPPDKPDVESSSEADLLSYGDELIEYLERRYPLQRDDNGVEIVTRF